MGGEWKLTRLGDHISVKGGLSYKKEFVDKGNTFLLGMGCVSHTERFLYKGCRKYGGDFTDTHVVRPGDLVIATRQQSDNLPILGFPAMIPSDFKEREVVAATNLYKVFNLSEISNQFLFWLLRGTAYKNRILECSKGTTVRMLTKDAIEDFFFDCPSACERDAIANILDALEDKIELNRKMNATLEQMARALFQSWFVDFDPVHAKAAGRQPVGMDKATADLFPDSFVDSKLSKIPTGWSACPLDEEFVEIVKGRSYRSDELAESKTALVTLKSFLRGGGYRPDGLKPFTGEYKTNQIVRPGDLIVAFTDVTQAADVIGKPALVSSNESFETLVASLDVGIVRPKSKLVSIPFLYCLFRTPGFEGHTYSHATGTTVLHLSSKAIPSFVSIIATIEIVEEFEKRVKPIFNLIDVNSKQSSTLSALRDTLLPKLLSGELRVKELNSKISA